MGHPSYCAPVRCVSLVKVLVALNLSAFPRRFRTHFFVTFLHEASSSGFSAGDVEERIPTPDGGQEVISARFVQPKDAIAECREGKIFLMPPQFYILSTLSDILRTPENTAVQREQVETLSRGAFGRMVINPEMLPGRDEGGRNILTFEGDETRGGPQGRLHRALVKSSRGVRYIPCER
jgi:hypothetical protein